MEQLFHGSKYQHPLLRGQYIQFYFNNKLIAGLLLQRAHVRELLSGRDRAGEGRRRRDLEVREVRADEERRGGLLHPG